MYAFTVGFKEGDAAPTLLHGPDTSVEKQDGDLDRAALIDDGAGYVTVEIVYSNGRPKRRVDFTTPAQKAARIAREAAVQAKKEAAAQEQNKTRIAALKAELAELEAGPAAPFAAEPVTETAGGADGPIGEPGPAGTEGVPATDEPASAPAPEKTAPAGAVSGKRGRA
jgi:hypothetical protein